MKPTMKCLPVFTHCFNYQGTRGAYAFWTSRKKIELNGKAVPIEIMFAAHFRGSEYGILK